MRIKMILGLAYLSLGGCTTKETVDAPPPPPVNWQSLQPRAAIDAGAQTATANERDLPDKYAAAIASPKLKQLAPLLDDNVHFGTTSLPDSDGPDAVVRSHEMLFGAFDDRKMVLARVWRTPQEQVLEWVMTGRQARDWMGVAATQKPVAFKGVTLLGTRDDGTVKEIRVYFDTALVKAQLGTMPSGCFGDAGTPAVSAPADKPQLIEQSQTGSADEHNDVVVARGALEALESNQPAYVGAMADDLEVSMLEEPQPAKGKAAAKAFYDAMHRSVGQLDVTVKHTFGIDQYAIVEYNIDGEQLGPIGCIPAQPYKVIRFEVLDICQIKDGKISRIWRYDDPAQIAGP